MHISLCVKPLLFSIMCVTFAWFILESWTQMYCTVYCINAYVTDCIGFQAPYEKKLNYYFKRALTKK